MYEYLEGRIVRRIATRIVLDVGGIGYDVAVPLGSDFRSPRAHGNGPGEGARDDGGVTVRVWTHLVVREDAHLLFGFADPETREVFRLLLQVRGVGPTLAQGILSSLPGDALLEAILAQDPGPLLRIKGVGKKTADQILLDLRDRAPAPGAGADVLVPAAARPSQTKADAINALVSIGYPDKQARKSVELAATKVDPEDLELLVRTALQG